MCLISNKIYKWCVKKKTLTNIKFEKALVYIDKKNNIVDDDKKIILLGLNLK